MRRKDWTRRRYTLLRIRGRLIFCVGTRWFHVERLWLGDRMVIPKVG
jgi:hypothetical protein